MRSAWITHFRLLPKTRLLAIVVATVCPAAFAIDVVGSEPPQAISDQKLTVGPRSVTLPAGTWSYVAKHVGSVSTSQNNKTVAYQSYAIQTAEKTMRAGVVLYLPEGSMNVNGWRSDPCKVEDALFRDTLGSNANFPECLLVLKRGSHLKNSTAEFYLQAKQWVDAEGIKPLSASYEIAYFKYTSGDMGWIRVFLPAKDGQSEQDVITWAKALPAVFAPLFSKRIETAALPVLP